MKLTFLFILPLVFMPVAHSIQTGNLTDEGYAQFFRGKLENLSLSQQGELEAAPQLVEVARLKQPVVWAAVPDGKGGLVLGTGNRGEVLRLASDGTLETLFAPDVVLSRALAVASDGSVLVGTSPDGAIYRLPPGGGRPEVLVDLPETYIWSFVLEEDALWVVTGLSARLYRISLTPDFAQVGEPEVWLETADSHFNTLVRDDERWLIGSSGKGIVYAVTAKGQAFALAHTDEEEVRSIHKGADGRIYFTTYSENQSGGSAGNQAREGAAPGELPPFVVTAEAPSSSGRSARSGTGYLYRIETNGFTTALWRSTRSGLFSLTKLNADYWLGGSNDEGKLFYFADRDDWGLLQQLPRGGEISVIQPAPHGNGFYLFSSNPGVVYRLGGTSDQPSVFHSRVLDARQPVQWGTLELTLAAQGPVTLSTRSGNTASADATWSSWEPLKDGTIASPISRFIQYRVEIPGDSPARILRTRIFYQMPNIAPQISALRVLNFGTELQSMQLANNTYDFAAVFRDPPTGMSEQGGEERFKLVRRPEQTLRTVVWRANDPNGDPLSYDVAIRPAGGAGWTTLARDLRDPLFVFNAAGFSPGYYQIRLSASDHHANPPEGAQRVSRISDLVLLNTVPPTIEKVASESGSGQLVLQVSSLASRLIAAQVRIDGEEPVRLRPRDGLFDQLQEQFIIQLPPALTASTSIVFEVLDESGNQALYSENHRPE